MGLMNGLSSLGAGLSAFAGTAGLEAQRASLAQQNMVLADQLAGTRETNLQASGGVIAAAAATQAQKFQEEQSGRQIAATASEGSLNRTAEMARTQATINAEPPEIKLFRALGVLPPKSGAAVSGPSVTPSVAPDASASAPVPLLQQGSANTASGTTADQNATSPKTATSPAVTGLNTGSSMPQPNSMAIINKVLGIPLAGSEGALRMGLAADVAADPAFKYKTPGQQAAETEIRVAVSSGKMTDPASRNLMAAAIAAYKIAPLSAFSLTKPGGPETMARVMEINPEYNEPKYPEIAKTMSDFGSGKQGDIIRSLNVGVQHLDVLDQAATALNGGTVQALNLMKNAFTTQFGSTAPTTFNALKQIVGTEIEKAVAGGIGATSDRDRIMKSLDAANTPDQLKAVTDGFRSLMVGQLSGLKTQFEAGTFIKSGPLAFENKLDPVTVKALNVRSAPSPAAPNVPSWVKPGDQYSPSRGQARGADGTTYGQPQ